MVLSAVSSLFVSALPCTRCGAIDVPRLITALPPHAFRADCAHCGRFLKFVSQYTPEEQAARREDARRQAMRQKAPTAAQLAYLLALGDTQAPPHSIAEASQRIQTLLQKKGGTA
jgi:hypothetical protein